MISVENSNRVIELRSTGLSFDNIAAITKISKPTVMKLCHDRKQEITNLHNDRNASTLEGIEQRKIIYQAVIEKASSELLSREFENLSSREIMSIISGAEKALAYLTPPPTNKNPNALHSLSDNDLKSIAQAFVQAV